MPQPLILNEQLDGIAGSKVSGAVATATTVTTNANLTGDVTSVGNATTLATVAATKGGTGQTGYATGDILYASSTTALSKLVVGTNGHVLTLAAGVPTWAAGGGGGTSYTLQPVVVATTANITLSGTQTIDGVAVVAADRVLVKNQTTASQNGIYLCAAGAWTRATDFTTGAPTLTGGVIIPVIAGTVNGGSAFQCMNTAAITIGSTSVVFGFVAGLLVSGLGAGTAPTATGIDCVVIGNGATSVNTESVVIGKSATQTGNARCVVIGVSATAGGSNGVAVGRTANAGTASSNVAIGFGATAGNGGFSIAIGNGAFNNANFTGVMIFSNAPNGGGEPDFAGQILFCTGQGASSSDAHMSFAIGGRQTTDATPGEIGIFAGNATTNPGDRIALTDDSSYIFDCDVVARNTATDTESAMYNLKFGIRRGAGAANTALVGTPVLTVIGEDTGATAWNVTVTADTTNGRPNISVIGEAAKTIRWVANIRMTKVSG